MLAVCDFVVAKLSIELISCYKSITKRIQSKQNTAEKHTKHTHTNQPTTKKQHWQQTDTIKYQTKTNKNQHPQRLRRMLVASRCRGTNSMMSQIDLFSETLGPFIAGSLRQSLQSEAGGWWGWVHRKVFVCSEEENRYN